MVGVYLAYRALNWIDENCGEYIEHFAGAKKRKFQVQGI